MNITIDELFTAVCSNDCDFVKEYYANGGEPNRRYYRFMRYHSLIAGAYRNGNFEMIKLLVKNGETILPSEEEELKEVILEWGDLKCVE